MLHPSFARTVHGTNGVVLCKRSVGCLEQGALPDRRLAEMLCRCRAAAGEVEEREKLSAGVRGRRAGVLLAVAACLPAVERF